MSRVPKVKFGISLDRDLFDAVREVAGGVVPSWSLSGVIGECVRRALPGLIEDVGEGARGVVLRVRDR